MEQERLFKVRDRRNKGWFYLDNEYLNGYAKIFGAIGTAIYVSLCRHADNETQVCFPSVQLIGEELGIDRKTVSKYLALFEQHRLISREKTRQTTTQKFQNNTYWLLDKSEWLPHGNVVPTASHGEMKPEPREPITQTHGNDVPTKDTHINYTHKKDTHLPDETNLFIELFGLVNPSYQILFPRKPQRDASARLLKLHDLEWWRKFMPAYQLALEDRYCPRAITPSQMEEKIGAIEHYGRSKKAEKIKGTNFIL